MGHGEQLSGEMTQFHFSDSVRNQKPISPLYLFSKAGISYNEADIDRILNKNNQIKSREYLNQTFRAMYYFLKPFVQ
jgi:hypothetical protein